MVILRAVFGGQNTGNGEMDLAGLFRAPQVLTSGSALHNRRS
jgi:hypothetical protein